MTVANEGDVTVAIDTRLTPPLVQEGWARDFVNRVQTMRKDAGLDVVDRIRVRYDLNAEIAAAVAAFADYIRSETLAVELRAEPGLGVEPVEVNGVPCQVAIAKSED